jgi:hypothetical protein
MRDSIYRLNEDHHAAIEAAGPKSRQRSQPGPNLWTQVNLPLLTSMEQLLQTPCTVLFDGGENRFSTYIEASLAILSSKASCFEFPL